MTRNAKIIALAVTVLVLGSAGSALARGHYGMGNCYGQAMGCPGGFGPGMGVGPGMMGNPAWSPEQRQEFAGMTEEFFNSIEPKRQELQAKRLELDALSVSPNGKPEDIARLSGEIAGLSGELRQAGQRFRDETWKKFGDSLPFYGQGMGRNGYHHGWRR